jgi:hypothetical protein
MKPSEQKANPLPKKFPHGMEKLTTAQTDFPGKDKLHNFRATRLGEFLLIGRLFILFGFLKIAGVEVRWCNFFHGRNYELLMAKNGLGYILGDSFTNSSGHPARNFHNKVFKTRLLRMDLGGWLFLNLKMVLEEIAKIFLV